MRQQRVKLLLLMNQITTETTRVENDPLYIGKIDHENELGYLKLCGDTSTQCCFAIIVGNTNGFYRLRKEFCGLSNIPTKFQ